MQRAGESVADAGLIPMAQAVAMRGGASYHDLGIALSGWTDIFRGADLAQITAKSVVTEAMLVEASAIAQDIFAITGEHSLREEKIAEVSDIRHRVFTVCVNRYEDMRRGATYMRWFEDDVEVFTPSLYSKGSRKTDAKPVTPAAPVVAAPAPAIVDATKPAFVNEVGHPNSSPFTS
jgi:hypothetical protein